MRSALESEPAGLAEFPPISLNVCKQCPNAQIPVKDLRDKIDSLLEKSDFHERYREHIGEPIKRHLQFKIALVGCPNACSQPQIMDIGIIGHSRVAWDEKPCDYCGICQEVCPDRAIRVEGGSFGLDDRLCLECGRCARDCPEEAIRKVSTSYQLLIGGRLGRRPRLGRELDTCSGQGELLVVLKEILENYLITARKGERFSGYCVTHM